MDHARGAGTRRCPCGHGAEIPSRVATRLLAFGHARADQALRRAPPRRRAGRARHRGPRRRHRRRGAPGHEGHRALRRRGALDRRAVRRLLGPRRGVQLRGRRGAGHRRLGQRRRRDARGRSSSARDPRRTSATASAARPGRSHRARRCCSSWTSSPFAECPTSSPRRTSSGAPRRRPARPTAICARGARARLERRDVPDERRRRGVRRRDGWRATHDVGARPARRARRRAVVDCATTARRSSSPPSAVGRALLPHPRGEDPVERIDLRGGRARRRSARRGGDLGRRRLRRHVVDRRRTRAAWTRSRSSASRSSVPLVAACDVDVALPRRRAGLRPAEGGDARTGGAPRVPGSTASPRRYLDALRRRRDHRAGRRRGRRARRRARRARGDGRLGSTARRRHRGAGRAARRRRRRRHRARAASTPGRSGARSWPRCSASRRALPALVVAGRAERTAVACAARERDGTWTSSSSTPPTQRRAGHGRSHRARRWAAGSTPRR